MLLGDKLQGKRRQTKFVCACDDIPDLCGHDGSMVLKKYDMDSKYPCPEVASMRAHALQLINK